MVRAKGERNEREMNNNYNIDLGHLALFYTACTALHLT